MLSIRIELPVIVESNFKSEYKVSNEELGYQLTFENK